MLKNKILSFYIPFVLIFIGFIALYSYLNWNFIIQPQSDLISKDIANFWLPMLLPVIPIFIIFQFLLKSHRPTWITPALLCFIAALCIAPAGIIAQSYLESASRKLIKIADVNQISQYSKAKYYTVRNYFIDKSQARFYSTCDSVISGWDFDMYVACPIMERVADTAAPFFNAWVTKKYYKEIGALDSGENHIPIEELFWEESQKDFEQTDMNVIKYLERIPNDVFYAGFEKTAQLSAKVNVSQPIILLEACNESFDEQNKSRLFWLFFSFFLGNGIFPIILYFDNKDYPITEFIEQSDSETGLLQ